MENLIIDKSQGYIRIMPANGYKLRKRDDNTRSFAEVDLTMSDEQNIENYIAVPETEPDEIVEEGTEKPTEDEEIPDSLSLAIIKGVYDNDES